MDKTYFVYIMASRRNGTLYIGITDDLIRRVGEHRDGVIDGFTKRYSVKHLVHYETFDNPNAAIHRETRLKKWKRQWKIDLIQKTNVAWDDLYQQMTAPKPLPEWLVHANSIDAERRRIMGG